MIEKKYYLAIAKIGEISRLFLLDIARRIGVPRVDTIPAFEDANKAESSYRLLGEDN